MTNQYYFDTFKINKIKELYSLTLLDSQESTGYPVEDQALVSRVSNENDSWCLTLIDKSYRTFQSRQYFNEQDDAAKLAESIQNAGSYCNHKNLGLPLPPNLRIFDNDV
jgi:hypothetical protein